ncbi:Gfo/Idh/MocA family protein [Paenibacillus cymbidii]|uniref:Gfo/Idh/MocA family protein n=1 Tax=Paenibacillus cymbidii TaxID=1639034 RepID=UPI0010811A68|nr:Gfo/Idh/MocA family oxidoreductase [Paenibacillus cymbidii]
MGQTFKAALIGAGERARNVIYPALAALGDVELAAICDIDPSMRQIAADRFGIERRYGDSGADYRRMIAEVEPDAVFAIGQPHHLYDVWMWCLERGLPLYIEKPLGLNMHQARALAHVAQAGNCITQVSFQRRITPLVVQLREECLKRGPIVHAVCKFYKSEVRPFLGMRDHMMDDCVHAIDTLRWICGGEVARVDSHVKRVLTPDINFISATLHFDNGATGYLLNSWSSGRRIFQVEMHAPNICAEAEHESKGYLYADGDTKGVAFDTKQAAGSDEPYAYTGVLAKCREFVDCCKEGRLPESHFGDALKTMEVAEIILAQALLAGK